MSLMSKIKLFFILLIILVVVLVIVFIRQVYVAPGDNSDVYYFSVAKGENVKTVSVNLKKSGLIRSKFVFETYVWLKGAESKIMAGEHQLSRDMTVADIFYTLTTGGSVENETQITIVEGWRAKEIEDYLVKKGLLKPGEFMAAIALNRWDDDYQFLKNIPAENIEGFLFPNTYRIFKDATVDDIIGKMLDEFDHQITGQMLADIAKSNKSIFEVITLASVVEREASSLNDEEMAMVADIFWKRIKVGLPLQSDATVNYITGKSDLRPSSADLEIDSPYNTYKYRGLPSGPIANPGLAAIRAVIYPKKNDYYYFITDTDGRIHFSKTYEGHQVNINKYLK